MITTEIEIAAAPDVVRKVFLDFPSYKEWHSGLVKSITPLANESEDPLAVGQKLHCEMEDFTFDSVITENSVTTFQWQGPPVMGIQGLHTFLIERSKMTPGHTTFKQNEEYAKGLYFLMQPWFLGRPIKNQFEKYNKDLKKRVESSA